MSLELIAWNPSKKRRRRKSKKSRGPHGGVRKRRRRARTVTAPTRGNGGRTMAKKKKGRKGRRRGRRTFSANTAVPTSGRRRRRGGGGGGFSLRSAFNVRQLIGSVVQGTIVGAAVAGSGIATQKIVAKVKPDLAANPWMMSAAQVGIGILGQVALGMVGLRKYAESWMSGSVAGATLNAYGAWQAQRAAAGRSPDAIGGMRGLAGLPGPNTNPNFVNAGRFAYSA